MAKDKRVYDKVIAAYLKIPEDQEPLLYSIDGIYVNIIKEEISKRDKLSETWRQDLLASH